MKLAEMMHVWCMIGRINAKESKAQPKTVCFGRYVIWRKE